nr:hypothetical protein [Terrabacter sp. Root181]
MYQNAITGFSPYSFPFFPTGMSLCFVISMRISGVVSTPSLNEASASAASLVGDEPPRLELSTMLVETAPGALLSVLALPPHPLSTRANEANEHVSKSDFFTYNP